MTTKRDIIRDAAEASLSSFIKLVAPHRVLGACHNEVIEWWTREEARDHQLLLLPRDHQKSAMIAYRVAWEITKDPTLTVLYISSTANLAEKQLYFIKNIFTSKVYQRYWPEMIHPDEGKRERWTASEIIVDHPARKEEGVRDPTIFTAGLTTTITGLHFDIAVLDDVVVFENAYTEEGRTKVESQYSLLSSIEKANAREWVVGTRYHPRDLYGRMMGMEYTIYNDQGEDIGIENIYEVFQKEVEDVGDGSGEYLWPRQQRLSDGKWFGFDQNILAKKREKYLDKSQFRAQYYNNPNDPDSATISTSQFQYYDRQDINKIGIYWYWKDQRINVYAGIDFAYSLGKRADWTAIVVIGINSNHDIYILDISRFKTNKTSEYFKEIVKLHSKWGFRKLRAEVNAAQEVIVEELKNQYILKEGMYLSIDPHKPHRYLGSKEERMAAILEPRYANGSIYHFRGGLCQMLEDELTATYPPHDDIKNTLSDVIEIAVAPTQRGVVRQVQKFNYHSRFGGVC